MLFLLGLMGVFAVGATALVWYEISARSSDGVDEDAIDAPEPADPSATPAAKANPDDTTPDDVDHIDELLAAAEDIAGAPLGASETSEGGDPVKAAKPASPDADISAQVAPVEADAPPVTSDEDAFDNALWTNALATPLDSVEADLPSVPRASAFLAAHQETVSEFQPDQDRLVIVFDDLADAFPVVGLMFDDDGSDCAHVTLNGARIATVAQADGLTLDHITLVPESSLVGRLAA